MQGRYGDYWDGFTTTDENGNLLTGRAAVEAYEKALEAKGFGFKNKDYYDQNEVDAITNSTSTKKSSSSSLGDDFWQNEINKLNNEGNKQTNISSIDYHKNLKDTYIDNVDEEEEVPDPEFDAIRDNLLYSDNY